MGNDENVVDDYPTDGTISDVKDWVGDDPARAQDAWDREDARPNPRVTLLDYLDNRLAQNDGDETVDENEDPNESVHVSGQHLSVSGPGDDTPNDVEDEDDNEALGPVAVSGTPVIDEKTGEVEDSGIPTSYADEESREDLPESEQYIVEPNDASRWEIEERRRVRAEFEEPEDDDFTIEDYEGSPDLKIKVATHEDEQEPDEIVKAKEALAKAQVEQRRKEKIRKRDEESVQAQTRAAQGDDEDDEKSDRSGDPEVEQLSTGDDTTADDLTAAMLVKVVPGLSGTPVVSPDAPSVIGNTTVELYTVDGTAGGAAANVLGRVQNFPVTAAGGGPRVSNPVIGTNYSPLVDSVTGVINNGMVPGDNTAALKLAMPPQIPNRAYVVGDSWIETGTGYNWVCTSPGVLYTLSGTTVTYGAARFAPFRPVIVENLDAWNAPWEPDLNQTSDYVAKNLADRGTQLPADPSNYADGKYTTAIKAAAARQAYGPGQIVAIGGFANQAAEDAAYAARFTADYVVGNVVHPSAVSYLIAATFAVGDVRPEDVYDIKPNWPYEGGDGVLANATVGMGPRDTIGTVPSVTSATGVAAAGGTTTVTGKGFYAGSKVYVDGVVKTTTYGSATSVTAPTGAQSAGTHQLRVDGSNSVGIVVT